MSAVAIEHDDRGDGGEYHFGFVYFVDGKRVAYTTEHGVVADVTGGWGAITSEHVREAKKYLDVTIPGWHHTSD